VLHRPEPSSTPARSRFQPGVYDQCAVSQLNDSVLIKAKATVSSDQVQAEGTNASEVEGPKSNCKLVNAVSDCFKEKDRS
jgi:hypothetical protein